MRLTSVIKAFFAAASETEEKKRRDRDGCVSWCVRQTPLLSIISVPFDKDESHRVDKAAQHYVITASKHKQWPDSQSNNRKNQCHLYGYQDLFKA